MTLTVVVLVCGKHVSKAWCGDHPMMLNIAIQSVVGLYGSRFELVF